MKIFNNLLFAASGTLEPSTETIAKYMDNGALHPSNYLDYLSHPDWSVFSSLTLYSILAGIIVSIFIIGIRYLTKSFSNRFRDVSLKWFFIIIWIYGFIVYDVGMCTGQYISLLTNAPLAILYAFKIFLFDSDVSEIHEPFHSNWFYSMNFAFVHFLAAIISTLFLLKYFGFNILSRYRMWRASSRFAKTVSETFVFWGFNENTVHLIESIKEKYKDSTDFRIIIVRTNKDNKESPEERTGFSRIFDFLAMPTSELEHLQALECLTVSTYSNLSNLANVNSEKDIFGEILNLKTLKKILTKHTSRAIHLLFLSDDEKENLHDVSALVHDSSIRKFLKEDTRKNTNATADDENSSTNECSLDNNPLKRQVIFYCLARYNSIHRVIEDQYASDQIKVKVVDSSHINVELLKFNRELLPVNFVDVEKDATVSSAFNALVVGFSEVGMDSVKFLYEFGAFVKTGSDDFHVSRSDFHLDVVDKNMSDLAGPFIAGAPAIKVSMPFLKVEDDKQSLITLHQMDCRSVQFYQKLSDDWIRKLNYVVIATEDDELNISLAVRIFKIATRYRDNLEKFCILVRCHNDDDGRIRGIVEHYNRIWAAYENAPEEKGKRIHQDKILRNQIVKGPIHVFGLDRATFTYANIIADELENKTRKYAGKYAETVSPGKKFKVSAWDDQFIDCMQLEKEWRDYSPTYFGIMNLRRTQSQDIANSHHELTKRVLADKALSLCKLEDFVFSRLTRQANTLNYIWPRKMERIEEINRIAIVIAQTEHLRWNASHEILGYIGASSKDEVRLEHDCLKDWNELREDIRSYDSNVADFILGISFSKS